MSKEEKILEKLELIQSQLKEHGQMLELVQTQLKEHGQMLSALIHASEVHKADNDNLVYQVAKLSGEIKEGFKEVTEIQKSLLEMYGSHEAEIRALKRRPV